MVSSSSETGLSFVSRRFIGPPKKRGQSCNSSSSAGFFRVLGQKRQNSFKHAQNTHSQLKHTSFACFEKRLQPPAHGIKRSAVRASDRPPVWRMGQAGRAFAARSLLGWHKVDVTIGTAPARGLTLALCGSVARRSRHTQRAWLNALSAWPIRSSPGSVR